ncbi:MAG: DUF3147 family protein [Anaerolineae bacterium]|nr:DUF3147 family protein [Anaerolineae bacterium]
MLYYVLKIVITTALIVIISEIAKRSTLMGGVLASIPLISVLAIIWLYVDTKNTELISEFSMSVFWLVIPSMVLFLTLPFLLHKGLNFYTSLGLAIGITIVCYYLMLILLEKFRIIP